MLVLRMGSYTTMLTNIRLCCILYRMKKRARSKLAAILRMAIERDKRSIYAIAKAARIPYQGLHPFVRGHRDEITLSTADRLCKVLGLELRPKGR